ncbi:MAG: hypothetical protein ACERKZ_12650 [Lachnotalea sp.]
MIPISPAVEGIIISNPEIKPNNPVFLLKCLLFKIMEENRSNFEQW